MDNLETTDSPASSLTYEDLPSSTEERKFTLKNSINIRDIPNGVTFELDPVEDLTYEDEGDDKAYFDNISLLNNLKFSEFDPEDEEDENSGENDLSPFESLARKMHPIEENGLVLKKEIKPGYGSVIPTNSVVIMHYSCYEEYSDEPFDSSILRNIPYRFLLGRGNAIPGVDIAVSTMKKGEHSQFIIKPECAYGKMGCPPRIPPNATILYNIEILNYFEGEAAIEFELMTPEEQKKASFQKIFEVCKMNHQVGNDCFKSKKVEAAVAKYRKATRLMEDISLASEEEDKLRLNLLLKLYLNLSLCYLNLKHPPKALTNAKRALEIDNKNTKAFFYYGRAYTMLGEYSLARKYLNRAKRNEPHNNDISQELLVVEEKEKTALLLEKNLCRKMFQQKTEDLLTDTISNYSDLSQESKDSIQTWLIKFKNNPEKSELSVSSGFSESEKDYIQKTAKSLNLNTTEGKVGSIIQIKIFK